MKSKLLLLAILLLNASFTFSQEKSSLFNIPKVVESAFHNDYVDAKILSVKYIKSNKKEYYKIETIISKKRYKITYDSKGRISRMEKEISIKQLPTEVLKSLGKKYPDMEIVAVYKVIENKKYSYKLNIIQNEDEFIIIISNEGKILSKEQIFEEPEMGC